MTNLMKCDEFEALLLDYLEENGLDAATRERADAHRLDCAACAALVAKRPRGRTYVARIRSGRRAGGPPR